MTLAPSRTTALHLLRRGFARVGVWSRGVDSGLFTPARRSDDWRVRVAGDAARRIVLYVWRLSPEKGLDTLVAAFRALDAPEAHLVVVGDGPSRGDLEGALAGRPATFTGYLRGEALAEAYASADVFAFPSATETFGQAVLEAMASALPVVACDAGGVRDLVRDGETGLLTRPGDAPAFAVALRETLAGDEVRARLRARGRAAAAGRTWGAAMDGLLDIYAQAVAGRGMLLVA